MAAIRDRRRLLRDWWTERRRFALGARFKSETLQSAVSRRIVTLSVEGINTWLLDAMRHGAISPWRLEIYVANAA
jgi:hypothetical protein